MLGFSAELLLDEVRPSSCTEVCNAISQLKEVNSA